MVASRLKRGRQKFMRDAARIYIYYFESENWTNGEEEVLFSDNDDD